VIHPSARIDPSAEVGDAADVGPNAVIAQRAIVRDGARIGSNTIVGRDALVDTGVSVGSDVRIDDAALLYQGVNVEDAVFIGPGAILTNARFPRTAAAARDVPGGSATRRASDAADAKPSPFVLRHGSSIGAGAVIVAPAEIGPFATVGAGAIVTCDVPGHSLVAGSPAQRLGWVCACGHRLLDSNGHPAPAKPERYAIDTDLVCDTCGRRFGYVPDGETLEQRTGPRQGAPA
jgi:UDP-2-acetamido-3-amino-2,3-dideoxy-glucuronate N-acetyltransferase